MVGFVSFVFILISTLSMISGFLFLSMSTGLFRESKTKLMGNTTEFFKSSTVSLRKFGIVLSGFGYTSFLIAILLQIRALNMI